MKKSLSPMTVSIALLCLLAVGSCHKTETGHAPPPPPSLQSQIVGKWTLTAAIYNSTQYGVTVLDTIPFTPADYCDFKADSTLSIMASGVAYNGIWQIDSSKVFISGTNYLDNPSGYTLPILDQHNLQLDYTTSAPNIFLEEKVILTK
jgi:hypothetical protein